MAPTIAIAILEKYEDTPDIVMKWTGHSDHKAMKPYIDIVDSIKA